MDWERFRKLHNLVKRQLNFQASNLQKSELQGEGQWGIRNCWWYELVLWLTASSCRRQLPASALWYNSQDKVQLHIAVEVTHNCHSLPSCVAPSNISQILSITTWLAPGEVINWVVGRPGNKANAYEHVTHTLVCGCVCACFFFLFFFCMIFKLDLHL